MVNVTVFLIEPNSLMQNHLSIGAHHVVTRKDNIMKEKLKLIDQAITAWYKGNLTDHAAFTAIQLIVVPQNPSEEAIKWAEKVAEKENEVKWNHTGLCMEKFDDTCFDECVAWEKCLKLYYIEKEGEVIV